MKQTSFFLFLVTTVLLIACNSNETTKLNTIDTAANSNDNAIVNNETLVAAYKNLDALEQLFGNENYLMVNGNDSSYVYFTRLGRNNFFTHSYKLIGGDSTKLSIDTIQVNKQGKVQWNWQGKKLILQECNDTKALWQNEIIANAKVDFIKTGEKRLSLTINNKQIIFAKTLPISLFFTRAKYDYEHHTNFAFDTTNFTKKH